mmetsp:Transcript_56/g.189  ORF Transcript_56/g.189 Transcript_56/m.189 type:complete len:549 (+) Transcript_56:61-1707(+)
MPISAVYLVDCLLLLHVTHCHGLYTSVTGSVTADRASRLFPPRHPTTKCLRLHSGGCTHATNWGGKSMHLPPSIFPSTFAQASPGISPLSAEPPRAVFIPPCRLSLFSLVLRLHCREEDDLLDVVLVGQKHRHAINPHAPPSSGREAILKGGAKGLIHIARLVVSCCLGLPLFLEALPLSEGIVQLRVGVGHLLPENEEFKSLGQPFLRPMPLGKRRHDLRVFCDKRGPFQNVVLHKVATQLVQQPCRCVWFRQLEALLVDKRLHHRDRLRRVEGSGDLLTRELLDLLNHRDPTEGGGEVDSHWGLLRTILVVLDLEGPVDRLHHLGHQLLSHVHQIIVVCVCHVELAGGELRVVREVDALVSEIPPDLVHPVHAPYHQHLQVELGGDAHEEVQVQLVVVSDEGTGGGPSRNHVHHRRLHLNEASEVEEASQKSDNLGPDAESDSHFLVDHQIQIPLSISDLLILQPRLCLRKHVEARGEERRLLGEHRQLPLLRLPREAPHPDNISSPKTVVDLVVVSCCCVVVLQVCHHLDLHTVCRESVEAELLA